MLLVCSCEETVLGENAKDGDNKEGDTERADGEADSLVVGGKTIFVAV